MTSATQRSVRVPLGIGALALTLGGFILVPTAAQAAENVNSSYTVFCEPDQQSGDSSTEPAGVSYDSERNGVTASPEQRRLTARAAVTGPDYCDGSTSFGDRLTVAAGSSGLQAGDLVPVTVTVTLDAAIEESWDDTDQAEWSADADFSAEATITALDGCEFGGELQECDIPLWFKGEHRHELDASLPWGSDTDGYIEARAHRSWDVTTNAEVGTDPESGEPLTLTDGEYVDENRPGEDPSRVCEAWPCGYPGNAMHEDPVAPVVFSGPANLVVGYDYSIAASLDWAAHVVGNPTVATSATVDDFSFSLTPAAGYEGVDLGYASQGETPPPADTVAPTFHGVQDITVPADENGSAVVEYALTATDDVDPAPAVVCTPPSGSRFAWGSFPVLCRATDAAGNTVETTFTVRVTDETAPALRPLPDLTATAGPGGTAVVTWTAIADDNVGETTVTCTPASGSAFPVGHTTVTCTATDASGNTASDSFVVTVAAAQGDVMDRLRDAIRAANVSPLVRAVLLVSHGHADGQFDTGRTRAGCGLLQALDAEIQGMSARRIPAADAATMRALIAEARSTYHC